MNCPKCNESAGYTGWDDGGGDYGDSLVEMWLCPACDYEFEGAEIPYDPADDDMLDLRDLDLGGR